jgi:hypothetical protein
MRYAFCQTRNRQQTSHLSDVRATCPVPILRPLGCDSHFAVSLCPQWGSSGARLLQPQWLHFCHRYRRRRSQA